MTTPKDEIRIRVTVKRQDAEDLKVLCKELLHEARAHDTENRLYPNSKLVFDFWLQAYHIAHKKLPDGAYIGPASPRDLAEEIVRRQSPEYLARHGGTNIEAIVGCACGWEGSVGLLKDEACPVCSKAFAPFPFTAPQTAPGIPIWTKDPEQIKVGWQIILYVTSAAIAIGAVAGMLSAFFNS